MIEVWGMTEIEIIGYIWSEDESDTIEVFRSYVVTPVNDPEILRLK